MLQKYVPTSEKKIWELIAALLEHIDEALRYRVGDRPSEQQIIASEKTTNNRQWEEKTENEIKSAGELNIQCRLVPATVRCPAVQILALFLM
jgi:hypothetical protein